MSSEGRPGFLDQLCTASNVRSPGSEHRTGQRSTRPDRSGVAVPADRAGLPDRPREDDTEDRSCLSDAGSCDPGNGPGRIKRWLRAATSGAAARAPRCSRPRSPTPGSNAVGVTAPTPRAHRTALNRGTCAPTRAQPLPCTCCTSCTAPRRSRASPLCERHSPEAHATVAGQARAALPNVPVEVYLTPVLDDEDDDVEP